VTGYAAVIPGDLIAPLLPVCRPPAQCVGYRFTCLIENGNQLTVCLPDVRYQPVTHLLEIFLVALQIACKQLFLAKDPQHEQQDLGYRKLSHYGKFSTISTFPQAGANIHSFWGSGQSRGARVEV
jgi:hypothetical protein